MGRAVYGFVHQLELHTTRCPWRQGHLRFALQSDDLPVVERADAVLRYWDAPAEAEAAGARSVKKPGEVPVSVTATRTDGGWEFTGSQAAGPIVLPDIATVIRAAETDAAMAVLNRPAEYLTVHGGLLARGDDAVLIVGPSESGKSTTSCALWAAGWQLLADDVTLLNPASATATPLLRRVSLRHPSRALLGEAFWQKMLTATTCDPTPEGYVFHPDEIEGRSRARSARLRAVVFLRRRGAEDPGPAQVRPIIGAQALLSLAPYTNVIRHGGMGETLTQLGPLVSHVPCYDMGRAPLAAMVNTIEKLVAQEVAGEPRM